MSCLTLSEDRRLTRILLRSLRAEVGLRVADLQLTKADCLFCLCYTCVKRQKVKRKGQSKGQEPPTDLLCHLPPMIIQKGCAISPRQPLWRGVYVLLTLCYVQKRGSTNRMSMYTTLYNEAVKVAIDIHNLHLSDQ